MDDFTRGQVRDLLTNFMDRWLRDALPPGELERIANEGVSPSGLLTPFHDALVPGITHLRERSFSTRLGNLHEAVATVIADEVHAEVKQALDLSGSVAVLSREFITQRVRQLRHRQAQPDYAFERVQILGHFGDRVGATIRIDLYIKTHGGDEYFFEMKSPKANLDQCQEMKQRLMTALAIRGAPTAHALWGIPYNPYGHGVFAHPFARPFFDFNSDAMVGEGFWDFVGDTGTYEGLLEIYRGVGEEFTEHLRELRERLIV
jgi:hypothetical protein